jgi:hypothetical protein
VGIVNENYKCKEMKRKRFEAEEKNWSEYVIENLNK